MKYEKRSSLTYLKPAKTFVKLKQKATSTPAKAKAARRIVPVQAVANVMDVTNFLAKYLSGQQNVVVAPLKGSVSGFSAGPRKTRQGKMIWSVNVPHWAFYDLPVKGFDKYRVYRVGVWHEASHVRFTPLQLFDALKEQKDSVVRELINVIEDRRIEELGVKEWTGYLPERIYQQAYGYALRPSVDLIQDQSKRRFEAFLQRLLIGKWKGKLDQAEAELVEKAAQKVEQELQELEKKKASDLEISEAVINLAESVKTMLDIQSPPTRRTDSDSAWEETFTKHFGEGVSPEEVEKGMEEFFKAKKREAKEKERTDGKTKPTEVTEEDVEAAKRGTAEVMSEYEKIQKEEKPDPTILEWVPVASQGPLQEYKDARFISAMNTYLQTWREGYKEFTGKSGSRFSVDEYIKHKDEPFVTRLKKSVKGKKILILADFSGSMSSNEDDYKKAIISSLTVLDSIGCNLGFFTFGGEPAYGDGFFVVKTFEQPKLTNTHLAKIAALEASYGCTPTDDAYEKLATYVQKHRPDVFITITDGIPDNPNRTEEMVKKLKNHTRMVAYGIAPKDPQKMAERLKGFGYHSSFAVANVHEIPPKLVNLIVPPE
jgi:hypothetical protein